MTDKMDVKEIRDQIVANLREHDFRPRDADGSDFQYGTDPGLRFKVGTVMGEVTITIWQYARQIQEPIRVLNPAQAVEAKYQIDALIHEFFNRRVVES